MTDLQDRSIEHSPTSEHVDVVASPERRSRPTSLDVIALVALVLVSSGLRVPDLGGRLWIDEGISIGIASHRLGQIPALLSLDGSPPLYYLLLHAWMALFGTSEVATHALSMTVSLAAIPVALWAGWSLFGRRVGWTLAALVALSPYLSYFATETRMYAVLMLLALVATTTFLHAFAFGRRRYRWAFSISLILILYSHNWGIWLAAGAAAALIPCAVACADRRRLGRDAVISFGLAGVAYLPWLPTLLFQRAHTGAPWSPTPGPREMVSLVADVLGDPQERVLVALILVAGPALWSILRRSTLRTAVLAAATMAGVPVLLGWIGAQSALRGRPATSWSACPPSCCWPRWDCPVPVPGAWLRWGSLPHSGCSPPPGSAAHGRLAC